MDKGVRGFGEFALTHAYEAVIKVPDYPKEIGFLHQGALLALSGEKKLSVMVRGLPAVKFEFARVLPQNVNQLVTQTQGDFNNPSFINPSFNQQNISQLYTDIQRFDDSDLTKQHYTALDFSQYLASTTQANGPQGLFLLQATGWDVESNTPLAVKANRLVLVTDMAMVVKDNQDGSHDVFVQSINQGVPLKQVQVSVLGKNGLPLLTVATDEQGHANFPNLKDYLDEREPVVYLASLGSDVSFIPFSKLNRQLNYSRFDIGGLYNNNQAQHSLSAYVFSDRGLYRPGDTAHIGMIVKQAFANAQPPGLIVEATVTDPRGTTLLDEKFTLDETGYLSLDFTSEVTSLTGQYWVSLYLVKDQRADSLLGSTNIHVAEFQPDRMRIKTHFSSETPAGWLLPAALKANVQVWNLYGAPAIGHRVAGKLLLEPKRVEFSQFPDYIFADPLRDPKKPAKVFTDTLQDSKTNEQGDAEFQLNLERFDKATYQLTFFAEGFEAEGGRSVTTQISALVSPLPYFVGYKADGDLRYIKQNSQRAVHFIAVNPQLKQQALADLTLQFVSLQPVSTLVKNPNGTYQYQSIIKNRVLSAKAFSLGTGETPVVLPTEEIGDFMVQVFDKNHIELSHFQYSVVGTSQKSMANNAELQVKLDRLEYNAHDEIELQITSPYTGAGLITIERDKVYAIQWFKSETTNSVQKIRIPNDFEGNGYVNVMFVRDWNSPDIFISPLSYSVAPFTVSPASHDLQITLNIPSLVKPGGKLNLEYRSDKPGKIIVFAADEGILQVANYHTPAPLDFFFQKRALDVSTQQTVDQILPQYIRARELSAVGGDGGEVFLSKYLNPFRRKTDRPVAFWSGIVDSDTTPRQLTYDIPDYFNGTLNVMAVAVAANSVGSAEKKLTVRGDFIISPNTPTFVAPGDEFEVSASIANNLKQARDANVNVQLKVTPNLEIRGVREESIAIAKGHELTVHFTLRATKALGEAKITWIARFKNQTSTMDATLSVRPASLFFTTLHSGQRDEKKTNLRVDRSLYSEYRQVDAVMSQSPLILVAGLQRYLDNFPYGCTEQLTSKAFPLLAMHHESWFAQDASTINQKIQTTIQLLRARQMSNGGISYWPGIADNASNAFASIYAMHFLTEAKSQGFEVPAELLQGGLSYLRDVASQNPSNLDMARQQAYAIYVLTRNEIVTTNYLTNLQLYLDKDYAKTWQQELVGAFVAATYQLLQNASEANRLIAQYQIQKQTAPSLDFYDGNIANAEYLYLVARHFPQRLPEVGEKLTMQLVAAINGGEINTLLSAYTTLALSAYVPMTPPAKDTAFSIGEILADGQEKRLTQFSAPYSKANLDLHATQVIFNNPNKINYFYQFIQAGFDTQLPAKPMQHGIEVYREYRDAQGNVVTSTSLGSELEVHIQARALANRHLSNMAIVDLLPGGFEVVRDSVKFTDLDYTDVREDRVIFFSSLDSSTKEIVYRIKAINPGHYALPAIFAESMYDPEVKAYSASGTMTVSRTRTVSK